MSFFPSNQVCGPKVHSCTVKLQLVGIASQSIQSWWWCFLHADAHTCAIGLLTAQDTAVVSWCAVNSWCPKTALLVFGERLVSLELAFQGEEHTLWSCKQFSQNLARVFLMMLTYYFSLTAALVEIDPCLLPQPATDTLRHLIIHFLIITA